MKHISLLLIVLFALSAFVSPVLAEEAEPVVVEEIEVVEVDVPVAPALVDSKPLDPAKVLAKVDGTEITGADVQEIVDLFLQQVGQNITPAQLDSVIQSIRGRVLDELIMRQVMLSAAQKQGITLSDEEFEEVLAELAASLPPGMTLEQMLEQTGATRDELRDQMLIRKMVMARAEAVSQTTEEEARAFYDENIDSFNEGETIVASHILLRTDNASPEEKAALREKIEGLRKELLEGADFAEVARENSDCPSSANGGDLGPFGRGVMVKPFEDAAFTQEVDAIGDVVETPFGYHLIKVTEQRPAQTIPFEEAKELIEERLTAEKQSEAVEAYIQELQSAADIERFDEEAPAEEEAETEE